LSAHTALLDGFGEQCRVAIGELKLLSAGKFLVLRYANYNGPGPRTLSWLLRAGGHRQRGAEYRKRDQLPWHGSQAGKGATFYSA